MQNCWGQRVNLEFLCSHSPSCVNITLMEHIIYLMTVEYKHTLLGPMSRSSPDLNKQYTSEFKKLRRQLKRKRHVKIELCVNSLSVTLYKIGGVHFRSLATNGFHLKAKTEIFAAASSCCHQNLKYENFTSSFARPCQNIAPKSVPHVQHDYFSSFNQSNH